MGSLCLHAAGTWSIPLVDRDEPRFAEASREMRERHDYVVPYFNNKYRFDKPPFIYWAQITSYRIFGENDFAARFPSAVAAALIAVLLFAWGRRLGNESVGWWAAIIFSLCFQTFIHARAAVADMWLVFFVTAAHWAGYELLADSLGTAPAPGNPRGQKYWRCVFYAALALAFLAKGPLGWIPLLTVASTKLFLRDRSVNRRFWFITGITGMLGLVLLWGIPALLRTQGEYFHVGIGRHVVERSFGALEGHGGQTLHSYLLTLPYYFVTIFISFFPWSIKLPSLGRKLWRQRDATDLYLISGCAILFLIMTVVKTKLPHYTLAVFPLLALLLARHLFELRGSPRFAVRTAVAAVVFSLIVSLGLFPLAARAFPTSVLFEKSRHELLPAMEFSNVDYFEPSVVWYFRSRAHGFFRGVNPEQVHQFMDAPGPRFIILPTKIAGAQYPQLPPGWKSYSTRGFSFVKGQSIDLTLILKPTQ
ncbi:MAG: glycosyltransferase family 39 protein [Verrucomicrobiota bacterium]